MSTPPITVSNTAAEIAAANAASQATGTPGAPPAAAANPNPPIATPPPPPQPYTLTDLGGGNFRVEYQGSNEKFEGTMQDILSKTAKAHVDTKTWANGLQTELTTLRATPPTPPTPPTAPPKVFADQQEEVNANYFADLLAKKAGLKSGDELIQRLGVIDQTTHQSAANNMALDFARANPDFNQTPENSEKLMKLVTDMGFARMMEEGDPKTAVNILSTVHAHALKTGVYTVAPSASAASNNPPPPPPPPPGTTPDAANLPDDLKVDPNMSAVEIKRRWELARARGLA